MNWVWIVLGCIVGIPVVKFLLRHLWPIIKVLLRIVLILAALILAVGGVLTIINGQTTLGIIYLVLAGICSIAIPVIPIEDINTLI